MQTRSRGLEFVTLSSGALASGLGHAEHTAMTAPHKLFHVSLNPMPVESLPSQVEVFGLGGLPHHAHILELALSVAGMTYW